MLKETTQKLDTSIYLLLIMAMLYVSFKLTCNPLFFRQTLFTIPFTHIELRVVSSAFVYPAIYVISDAIVALSNKKIAALIVLIGVLCDGLFSFSIYYISNLQMPVMTTMQQLNTAYINHLGPQIWALYYHGVGASVVTALIEIILFNFIFKKSRNFFIATVSSVIITLLVHNTITDYPMLKADQNVWKIIFNGLAMNISIMIIYAALVSITLYLLNKVSHLKPKKSVS